jgi:hypothetical protein
MLERGGRKSSLPRSWTVIEQAFDTVHCAAGKVAVEGTLPRPLRSPETARPHGRARRRSGHSYRRAATGCILAALRAG